MVTKEGGMSKNLTFVVTSFFERPLIAWNLKFDYFNLHIGNFGGKFIIYLWGHLCNATEKFCCKMRKIQILSREMIISNEMILSSENIAEELKAHPPTITFQDAVKRFAFRTKLLYSISENSSVSILYIGSYWLIYWLI